MRALSLALVFLVTVFACAGLAQDDLAGKYFTEGHWKKAVQEYKALSDEQPTVFNLNRLGLSNFYANNFVESQKAFERALKVQDNEESEILLAMVKVVRNREKLADLLALSDKYGDSALLMRSVGAALLHHKEHDEALRYLKMAEALDPNDYMTKFYIGLVHERKFDYDACMEDYKQSIELNPRFAQAVNNLGYCYKERHYYTYAIIEYKAAIAISPDNAYFHYNLGNAQTHKGLIPEALQQYKRATELDPTFAKAHYNLGRSYIALDRLEDGIAQLKLYLKHYDKSLIGTDAPPPSSVRQEIKFLREEIRDRKNAAKEDEEGDQG